MTYKSSRARGWVVGREEDKPPYRHLGVAVATWGSHKAPTMLRRCSWSNGSSFRSWLPNWYPPKAHSLNCDITGLAKCHPEKQAS